MFTSGALKFRIPSYSIFNSATNKYIRIKPIVYESIYLGTFNTNACCQAIESQPTSFVAKIVKTLFIEVAMDQRIEGLLHLCTGLRSIVADDAISYYAIMHLRPTHLSLPIFNNIESVPPEIGLNAPLFSCLTHLELYDDFFDLSLGTLPRLTHLALRKDDVARWRSDVAQVELLLEECIHLCFFLMITTTEFWHENQGDHIQEAKQVLEVLRFPGTLAFGPGPTISEYWAQLLEGKDVWEKSLELGLFRRESVI